MNVQYCSDLHLEFQLNWAWLNMHPLQPIGDILIIAGDTDYLGEGFADNDFFRQIGDQYEQVYLIPGNHEYYAGYDISSAFGKTNEKLASNITLFNNDSLNINGVRFIFTTMWAIIGRFKNEIVTGVSDFERIRFKNQPFGAHHFNRLHTHAFEFLEKEVQKEGPKVVVTHHLPSELCNADEFKGSIINDAFCVDKTDFIRDSDIDYWIYGHSHRNTPEFEINGTKLLTNQLGYVGHGENHSFRRDAFFEI